MKLWYFLIERCASIVSITWFTWTQRMANFYKDPFYVNDGYKYVGKMLEQQGFLKHEK
jgi:hypothetical protein